MRKEPKQCPACGSKQFSSDFGQRIFYACDSYSYADENKLVHQTDLCHAWQILNRIQTLVTTDHESKQAFIARVAAILDER